MPSLRHALVVRYVRRKLRQTPEATDEAQAHAIVIGRAALPRPAVPPSLAPRTRQSTIDGLSISVVEPPGPAPALRYVYLHGGAYVLPITDSHWTFISWLAEQTAAEVVVPEYALAPDATWTASRQQLLDLVGDDPEHTVLVGDSAGGGLALALAQAVVAEGRRLAGLVMMAPWVDLDVDETLGRVDDDPWLDADLLRSCGRFWAGQDEPRRPELSPIHGSMSGLPPTLVVSGTRDVLFPSSVALVEAMREAGVAVEHVVGRRLIHVYPLLPVPEAKAARAAIADFVAGLSR